MAVKREEQLVATNTMTSLAKLTEAPCIAMEPLNTRSQHQQDCCSLASLLQRPCQSVHFCKTSLEVPRRIIITKLISFWWLLQPEGRWINANFVIFSIANKFPSSNVISLKQVWWFIAPNCKVAFSCFREINNGNKLMKYWLGTNFFRWFL